MKFWAWVVQTLRDKKYDIPDTAEEIYSMLQEKILWEIAKIVATKSQMITNKWNSDEGYLNIGLREDDIENILF